MALKYIWLADQLREIIKEYIQAGQNRLPTEQELCARYRVSRQTVRAALNVLEETKETDALKEAELISQVFPVRKTTMWSESSFPMNSNMNIPHL